MDRLSAHLRALERREVRRMGDDKVRQVNVRIVAATNRSLFIEVECGRFREDLYHRLAEIVGADFARKRSWARVRSTNLHIK